MNEKNIDVNINKKILLDPASLTALLQRARSTMQEVCVCYYSLPV